jgi:hypothetical protein
MVRSKFLSAVIGLAAVALAASPASASTVIDASSGTGFFGKTFTSNAKFSDVFSVTLPNSSVTGSAITIGFGNDIASDIDFTSITLGGFAFTKMSSDFNPGPVVGIGSPPGSAFETWALTPAVKFAAGTYDLVLNGRAFGPASYAGTISVTAGAVPEPATWAMMIGGVGMVGGALRRRKVSTKVSFA